MPSYRPQIYNPQQGQFQRQPTGSFTETDGIVQPAIAQTLTVNTAIAPIASTIAISSATAIALTATPAIAPGIDANKFQWLTLINTGNNNITLQDEAVLAGSGLRLFKNNWVIRPDRSIVLLYRGEKWQQLFDGDAFKLQGYDVSSAAPTIGQALLFDGTIWSPSEISSEGTCLNQILYRDDNWGTGAEFQTSGNWVWRSRNPQTVGNASLGESATGKIRIGYIKLKNKLILTLLGGGSSNGSLKRIRLLKASDNATLIDVGLNSLIGNTDTGVACAIDTSSFNEVLAILELEDADNGTGWAWIGIDLSKHYASV